MKELISNIGIWIRALKWIWAHRDEKECRQKNKRMRREVYGVAHNRVNW